MARALASPWIIATFCCLLVAEAVVFKRGDSATELDARLARIQTKMAEYRLDAMLLTTEANVRYLTGYHSPFWQSPTRPWFVVVPAEGKVTAVVPTIGQDAFERANTGNVVTWPAPRPDDDGISDLTDVIGSIKNVHGRVGAELGPEMTLRMPILDFLRLQKNLVGAGMEIVDGGDVLKLTRLIKSDAEVAKVEATCQAISAAYREVPVVLAEGMTEAQACNEVKQLLLRKGADDTSYVICRSGPTSYSDIIGHPTDRVLQNGDMVILDTGCQIDGYYCDFNRNFAVGPPAQEVEEAYAKLYEATDMGLRAVKPGATFNDVYQAMANSLNVKAEGGVGRMGHSVGLQLTEWPSIMAGSMTVLEEGMVIAIEPSIDLTSGGGRFVVTEEDVVVTKTGYRMLSERAPTSIPSIISKAQNSLVGSHLNASIANYNGSCQLISMGGSAGECSQLDTPCGEGTIIDAP